MRFLAVVTAGLALTLGCVTAQPSARRPEETTPLQTTSAVPVTSSAPLDAVLEARPQLRVNVRAPATASYRPTALGIGGVYIAIRLTNGSESRVSVDQLHAAFSATRDGVEFPCEEHVGGSVKVHEPTVLEPQQSSTFERALDCTMPLPGLYHVRVYLHFGENEGATRAPRNLAGSFDLQVESTGRHPQPYPSRDGLYAIMTGTPLAEPTTENLTKSGYEVVIGLINGSPRPSRVGSFHFSYLVYREHDPLPCSGESETFAGPRYLAPGRVQIVKSRIACATVVEGHYEVVGKLVIENDGEGILIGRLNFDVTRDPTRRDPLLFMPNP